jgi:hypothetical protein
MMKDLSPFDGASHENKLLERLSMEANYNRLKKSFLKLR